MRNICNSNILFWPQTTNSSSEIEKFRFEHDGYLVGWVLNSRQLRSRTINNTILICAFIIPFESLYHASGEKEKTSHVTVLNNELANCDTEKGDKEPISIIAIWKSKIQNQLRNNYESHLAILTPGPNGPTWKESGNILTNGVKNFDQMTFYDPEQNYQIMREKEYIKANSEMENILVRLSHVKNVRKAIIPHLQKGKSISQVPFNIKTLKKSKNEDSNSKVEICNNFTYNETKAQTVNQQADIKKSIFDYLISSSLTLIHLKHRMLLMKASSTLSQLYCTALPLPLILITTCIKENKSRLNNYSKNANTQAFFDQILGLFVGLQVLIYYDEFVQLYKSLSSINYARFYQAMVDRCIIWLETFPIGFKLNVPFTKHMGKEIQIAIQTHTYVLKTSFDLICCKFGSWIAAINCCSKCDFAQSLPYIVSFVCILYGLSTIFTICFDILNLLTFHIQIIAKVFGKIQQIETSILSSLWLIFQGKKKNILRERTDSLDHHYDYMQLLLGILLFTIALFLFTTIWVYYIFFATISAVIDLILIIIFWFFWFSFQIFPIGQVWKRFRYGTKQEYSEDIYFVEIDIKYHRFGKFSHLFLGNFGMNYLQNDMRIDIIISKKKTLSTLIMNEYKPFISLLAKSIPAFLYKLITGNQSSILASCLEISNHNLSIADRKILN